MDQWQACLRLIPSSDAMLENGSSYERAHFDFARFRALVVPQDTIVRRGTVVEGFNIYLEKQQTYAGWPEKKFSIADLRAAMGVAYRISGQAVALATYGEWKTPEGSGVIRLSVLVPPDLEVRVREDLGGPAGMANSATPGVVGPGPGYPKAGWTGIATQPNAEAIRI